MLNAWVRFVNPSSVAGAAIASNQTIALPSARKDPRYNGSADEPHVTIVRVTSHT